MASPEPGEDLVGAFGKRVGIGAARAERGDRRRVGRHHVARQLEVDRHRMIERVAQHPRDLAGRVRRIVEPNLIAGDLPEHAVLRVQGLGLVMEQKAAAALGRRRRARDHHHRRALGAGAGDRVDQVEGAGAVGDRSHAEPAADPRRAIRREAHARLVAQRVQRQNARFLDHLEERQSEIAGDSEDPGRTVVLERMEERFGEVHGRPPEFQPATMRAGPGVSQPVSKPGIDG